MKMVMVMMIMFLIMCLADVQRLRGLAGSHHKAQVHDQVSFIPGHHHYVYGDDDGGINHHMYITIIIVFHVTNDFVLDLRKGTICIKGFLRSFSDVSNIMQIH